MKKILLFKHIRKNKSAKSFLGPVDLEVKVESVETSCIDAQPLCLEFTR